MAPQGQRPDGRAGLFRRSRLGNGAPAQWLAGRRQTRHPCPAAIGSRRAGCAGACGANPSTAKSRLPGITHVSPNLRPSCNSMAFSRLRRDPGRFPGQMIRWSLRPPKNLWPVMLPERGRCAVCSRKPKQRQLMTPNKLPSPPVFRRSPTGSGNVAILPGRLGQHSTSAACTRCCSCSTCSEFAAAHVTFTFDTQETNGEEQPSLPAKPTQWAQTGADEGLASARPAVSCNDTAPSQPETGNTAWSAPKSTPEQGWALPSGAFAPAEPDHPSLRRRRHR